MCVCVHGRQLEWTKDVRSRSITRTIVVASARACGRAVPLTTACLARVFNTSVGGHLLELAAGEALVQIVSARVAAVATFVVDKEGDVLVVDLACHDRTAAVRRVHAQLWRNVHQGRGARRHLHQHGLRGAVGRVVRDEDRVVAVATPVDARNRPAACLVEDFAVLLVVKQVAEDGLAWTLA